MLLLCLKSLRHSFLKGFYVKVFGMNRLPHTLNPMHFAEKGDEIIGELSLNRFKRLIGLVKLDPSVGFCLIFVAWKARQKGIFSLSG